MRLYTKLLLCAALLLLLPGDAMAQTGGDYDVTWHVMGTAGDDFTSGGDYQLGFTVGQIFNPVLSRGGSYGLVTGFWRGASGRIFTAGTVYLPVVIKNHP
jgi:hypothetical protein